MNSLSSTYVDTGSSTGGFLIAGERACMTAEAMQLIEKRKSLQSNVSPILIVFFVYFISREGSNHVTFITY